MSGRTYLWLLFIALAGIWGSSFILMKWGMEDLTPWQVASVRLLAAGICMLPLAFKAFSTFTRKELMFALLSGMLGSGLPAYLFCLAETKLDSALAGSLNSLTPVFVLLIGIIILKMRIPWVKHLGVAMALVGTLLLVSGNAPGSVFYPIHAMLVVIATISYAANVHLVHRKLNHLPSIHVVSIALIGCMVLALVVLNIKGLPSLNPQLMENTGLFSAIALGVLATALASVLFYQLIRGAGVMFSSMVTYAIPIVANIWGVLEGEKVGWWELVCLAMILGGVYIVNRPSAKEVS